jgi:histidine ammonia-lyase
MIVGGNPLGIDDVAKVVYGGDDVEIDPNALDAIEAAARYVRQMAESGEAVYGVTTGFGANRNEVIRREDAETLQERLIMSHACGVGDELPADVVRAMMLLRIVALSRGNSGVRPQTLQLLVDMLNSRVHPVIPEKGSVGASGDLCPLAHMCLPVIGLGEVEYRGQRLPGAEGMKAAGLQPIRLTYKEGLALLNGTQAQTALGVIAAIGFQRLLDTADVIGAMSFEAVAGRLEALDARIHELRGRPGQIRSAANLRTLLEGSQLAGAERGEVEGKVEYIQDSYCLRCMPQVHGACRDVLEHLRSVLATEINAVTDNPLVFAPGDDGEGAILSGGNFHGEPVAMALDYLKIAIAELANISERRSAKLTDKYFSEGLPPFLVSNPGLNSGMMIPQYVAAALVSENKTHAHPASVDSIPTSANMEDHVSMGMHAGLGCLRILRNADAVLGIEYLIAAQGLDLREGYAYGRGTKAARDLLRTKVSFMHEDRVLYPDVEVATELVYEGAVRDAVADLLEE